ncbi:hypothetical protein FBQ97_02930 [Acidobacteria bacterium ACD]|nr:MAG: hypothetical protein EDX89_04385 [Acidobacteriota bacterium]MCE7956446.1 hypothetical protein [Acidobacteria bacterium ACB2]MDL1948753.1 hypothetical protein [Acidobacteria bacterium ACD]
MKYAVYLLTIAALVGGLGRTGLAAADAPKGESGLAWEDCEVCIVGTPVVRWNGNSGSIHVDRVENRSHTSYKSRNLGLQVQLQLTYPDVWRDFGVGQYEVSEVVPLGPLPIGSSRDNIDSGRIAFDGSEVPPGEYFLLVMIVDDFPGWPHFDDFVVMNEKAVCDGMSCRIGRPCSATGVAGDWGYTKTGTLFLPTGATPFATLGILSLDESGNLTGVNTGSVGGNVSADVLTGTFQVNPDCTGTATVEVHAPSGALLRTIGMSLVVDEDASHLRGIVTSLVLPSGVSLPSVITADARRVPGKPDTSR